MPERALRISITLMLFSYPVVLIAGVGDGKPVPFLRGDVNQDGDLDIGDPVSSLLYQFGDFEIFCEDAADFDDDSSIGIGDAIGQLQHLFRGGISPAPPYPAEGIDPTPDDLCCQGGCDETDELPDLTGLWSGTFFDELVGEYVVAFEVKDSDDGALILRGLESIGNEIFGGEVFKWDDGELDRYGLDYFTSFDIVEGSFVLDGDAATEGVFETQSATGGTFTMERVDDEAPTLYPSEYKIVFVNQSDTAASGGTLSVDDSLCGEGNVGGVASLAKFELSTDDGLFGVHTATIEQAPGVVYRMIGLVAWDTGIYSGTYVDAWNDSGFFLMVPEDYDEQEF